MSSFPGYNYKRELMMSTLDNKELIDDLCAIQTIDPFIEGMAIFFSSIKVSPVDTDLHMLYNHVFNQLFTDIPR